MTVLCVGCGEGYLLRGEGGEWLPCPVCGQQRLGPLPRGYLVGDGMKEDEGAPRPPGGLAVG